MKSKTHIYMANLLIDDIRAGRIVLPGVGHYSLPKEVEEAVVHHPAAFRAGAVGPDFYPDILLGQAVIHPDHSGIWLELMFDRLLVSPLEEREKNLSFMLGYMLHYAGDMFGHAYVNSYAGGWFPSYKEIVSDPNKAKIVARHMLVETYMDQKVPASASMQLSPPLPFIYDVFTCNKARRLMGSLDIDNCLKEAFGTNSSITNPLGKFMEIRDDVHAILLTEVIGKIPLASDYIQHWEENVESGILAWLETWCDAAQAFSEDRNDQFSCLKYLLESWFFTKFPGIIGIPGFMVKIISFLKELDVLKPLEDYIRNIFRDFLIAVAKAILGGTYTTIEEAIEDLEKVFKDPKTYLDSGIVFAEKNVSQKLDRDFGNYGKENDTTKQTFHAVYQCLNMGKLCLIGTENLNSAAGRVLYKSACYTPAARIGRIRVQTKDELFAGTDNNVYIGIRYNGSIYETLCDKPGYDDFERGDNDTYKFAVPECVNLDSVDAITARMSGKTADGGWNCERIEIKNANDDVLFCCDEGFCLETGTPRILENISREYNIPQKTVHIDPRIMSFLWSLDGKGTDASNPAKQPQWEIGFIFWSDSDLHAKIFHPLFEVPYNPGSGAITGLRANTGNIVDGITFLYSNGEVTKIGGPGGIVSGSFTMKPGEKIISTSYSKSTHAYLDNSISNVEFTTNLGGKYSFNGSTQGKETVVVNAPAGKYIASFKGSTVFFEGHTYLSAIEIQETKDL